MKSLEEREQRERHRHEVVSKATRAAHEIIMEGSDGSVEETNYLTAQVARDFVTTALYHFSMEMLKKDLE